MIDEQNRHGMEPNDSLDAGLHAAFAFSTHAAGTPHGHVLAALEETVGPCTRVLLRDAPDDQTPLVLPLKDSEAAGKSLHARYQVMGEIARGGVGVVMKSRDADLGRDVAMKVLRDDHRRNRAMVQRFVEEAQISGQLQHPGILPIYELGLYDDETPYFTMKLVKGQTLSAQLAQREDPAEERARFITIFEQVCQTLAFAHSKGVIHRDLKPSNVMVGTFGEVQVVDWGLAKVLQKGGLADERQTAGETVEETVVQTVRTEEGSNHSLIGSVMGTPTYMPPEQAAGEIERLNERSDVFSLGALLCEILTGRPPYGGSRDSVLRQAREGDLKPAFRRIDQCGADQRLIGIAKQCLAPDMADRPCDAGVLARDVASYLESLEERARKAQIEAAKAEARANAERRGKRLAVLLVVAVMGALLIGGVGWAAVQRERVQQIQERSDLLTGAIERGAEALGRAVNAPVGHTQPWVEVGLAAEQIRTLILQGELDDNAAARASDLLSRMESAQRDRRMTELIEEVVIVGATHQDKQSWLWMEEALRTAFRDYGIDLDQLTPVETAEKIQQSDLVAQLTDGLELWIGTRGHLMSMGVNRFTVADTMKWLETLYLADPDPFATAVRKLVYGPTVSGEQVERLANSVDFADVRPRTLAWLGSASSRTGDVALVHEVFEPAVMLYPDDFMLNFDYAFILAGAKEWQDAIRYYERCLAIRPRSGGIWRSLGIALREIGDLNASRNAIERSIQYQPDHAPTYVELANTQEKLGDRQGAIEALKKALTVSPEMKDIARRLDSLNEQ